MNYGLYASASGVLSNSYRQDVIANNIANAETVGFKRDLAVFQERRTAAQRAGLNPRRWSNPALEGLGGGVSAAATYVDLSGGELEHTNNPLDLAIRGEGFFAVREGGEMRLTRAGAMVVNRAGNLALATTGQEVLNDRRQAIGVPLGGGRIEVSPDGTLSRDGESFGRVGLFDVPERDRLVKAGHGMFRYPELDKRMIEAQGGEVVGGMVERSNVEPTTELAQLMDAQRLLEANANMIRYQDQTLQRLVNDVGSIG